MSWLQIVFDTTREHAPALDDALLDHRLDDREARLDPPCSAARAAPVRHLHLLAEHRRDLQRVSVALGAALEDALDALPPHRSRVGR